MKKLSFDSNKCVACRTCELACCIGHSKSRDLFKAIDEKDKLLPRIKITKTKEKNFTIFCRHCTKPKCVEVCKFGAMYKDAKTGYVLCREDKCTACWSCVKACPFVAVKADKKKKVPVKCDLCIEIGNPQCAEKCPTGAIKVKEDKK